jgi:hypothetical protein
MAWRGSLWAGVPQTINVAASNAAGDGPAEAREVAEEPESAISPDMAIK